jgi:hypothetical protein
LPRWGYCSFHTFTKASEIAFGLDIAYKSVKPGGEIVLIGNAPTGQVAHYLFGSWGNTQVPSRSKQTPPDHVGHLYIFNEYPEMSLLGSFSRPEKVSLVANWKDILDSLKKSYPDYARVVVYPNADIQYYAPSPLPLRQA